MIDKETALYLTIQRARHLKLERRVETAERTLRWVAGGIYVVIGFCLSYVILRTLEAIVDAVKYAL